MLTAQGFGVDGLVPGEVLRPVDAAGVAGAIASVHAAGQAVIPWGGGTHMALGNRPARYDVAVCMAGLDRIREHAPADLTMTVEAGATLAAVQRELAPHGQFLPLEAEDPARATIGGLLAANVAGPMRLGHGTARDRLLWTEVVLPDGTLTAAGAKVVKSVAGYELPKLHLGALGGLGLITAACFKVQPLAATSRTLVFGFEDPVGASALASAILEARVAPVLCTIVHGLGSWGPPFSRAPWNLAVGADGSDAATTWQVERLQALGRAAGANAPALLEGPDSAVARQALMTHRGEGPLRLRAVVPPAMVSSLPDWLDFDMLPPLSVHVEAGNGVVRVAYASLDPEAWRLLADLAHGIGGHWVLEACPTSWKYDGLDIWGPPRPDRALMQRVKQGLDPAGTLSPGRGIGG